MFVKIKKEKRTGTVDDPLIIKHRRHDDDDDDQNSKIMFLAIFIQAFHVHLVQVKIVNTVHAVVVQKYPTCVLCRLKPVDFVRGGRCFHKINLVSILSDLGGGVGQIYLVCVVFPLGNTHRSLPCKCMTSQLIHS